MVLNNHTDIRRRKEMTFTTIAQDPDLPTADTVLLTDEVLRMVNHRSALGRSVFENILMDLVKRYLQTCTRRISYPWSEYPQSRPQIRA